VRLLRTRNPGKAIVAEAIERHSDLVYISTRHASNDERLLGKTVRYVLAHRPCRIVIEGGNVTSLPTASGDGGARSTDGVHTPARERGAAAPT